MKTAQRACSRAGLGGSELLAAFGAVLARPEDFEQDEVFGELARALLAVESGGGAAGGGVRVGSPAPFRQWGRDLDPQSIAQMQRACELPVTVSGAIMPDAHVGYGLPIGGVLATQDAVIPYAVGVDIACRMKLTVLDLPAGTLDSEAGRERLTDAIESQTRFGTGATFQKRRQHEVMDRDWDVTGITRTLKDKAWSQLGTSGSGNHFVEFGTLTITDGQGVRLGTAAGAASDAGGEGGTAGAKSALGLAPGVYLAFLSHSGSRGAGATICNHYSKVAMDLHRDLPKEHRYLAWLDMDGQAGQEYWAAMSLMGAYAAANHACIHRHIAKHLGVEVLLDIENHHNFAWKETHEIDGVQREVIVHRKGATPAHAGVLGIIPGSMASPGFVVRGKGVAASLGSASHGAGRAMSRTAARASTRWSHVKPMLEDRGVTLLSAGIDEAPVAYKDIHAVMEQQRDLVDVLARFDPRLVKMAPEGEKPED